ncbi:hypothetical protein GCM10010339_71540 [Streptomyces alanosinicus]|uniref:Uncharacterized protein n=1 Tax=Streptomyces alanosinicus TaxID=68171 RepID=A0A919D676_9ACTN|nr:hypothetical protein GCM10010339_71540 [Streptomyces alanosinicus]
MCARRGGTGHYRRAMVHERVPSGPIRLPGHIRDRRIHHWNPMQAATTYPFIPFHVTGYQSLSFIPQALYVAPAT